MHVTIPQHLLATISSGPALAIVALACLVPIVAILSAFYFKHQREKLWHETARIALEKGQPVPPRPLCGSDFSCGDLPAAVGDFQKYSFANRRWKDIRNGLIMIGVGGALFLSDHHSGGFLEGRSSGAYILLGIGGAFLISGLLSVLFVKSPSDSSPRPPNS